MIKLNADICIDDNGNLKTEINFYDLLSNLDDEQKLEMAGVLGWGCILDEAVNRLTGQSGNWSGADPKLTLDVLCKMEDYLLSRYKWSYLKELNDLAKNIISHEHIYWKLYHDEKYGDLFRKWLTDNNIESNYTMKFKKYEDFEKWVENTLEKMKNETKE